MTTAVNILCASFSPYFHSSSLQRACLLSSQSLGSSLHHRTQYIPLLHCPTKAESTDPPALGENWSSFNCSQLQWLRREGWKGILAVILPEGVSRCSWESLHEGFIASATHWHKKENLQNFLCCPHEATQHITHLYRLILRSPQWLNEGHLLQVTASFSSKSSYVLMLEDAHFPEKWTGLSWILHQKTNCECGRVI